MASIVETRPRAHFCCITNEVMVDPVMDREGNTYERSAIMKWLSQGHTTSPLTRNYLDVSHLTTNRALKDAIEAYVPQPGEHAMSMSVPTTTTEDTTHMTHETKDNAHCVTLHTPDGQVSGIDVSLVLDCSGSMSALVKASGSEESDGLSRLDLCKYAAKTIINGCRPEDRVSLVQFSSDANVRSELVQMDAAGKAQMKIAVTGLSTSGSTNIWDALKKSLDTFPSNSGRPGVIMLLTDGCPNILPPRGHIHMLQKYFDKRSDLDVVIHTYGFGYDLDSKLLRDIAVATQGTFSFIPDSGLLGTTFIHAWANTRTTLAHKAILSIETDGSVDVLGLPPERYIKTSWGYQIPIGPLSYGQTRQICFQCDQPAHASISYNGKQLTSEITPCETISFERQIVVDTIQKCSELCRLQRYDEAVRIINTIVGQISDTRLKEDLSGELSLSCANAAYQKWGRHYHLSLAQAHWRQQCNNFKDPGLQMLGGVEFRKVLDQLDDIFDNMPPPKPSCANDYDLTYRSSSSSSVSLSAPLRMATYRDSSAPCISGNSIVHMKDGSKKRVDAIRMGDIVLTDKGFSPVVCVIKTICENNKASLVSLSPDLHLTEWHPVRINNQWTFPVDIDIAFTCECEAVYSFVLEPGHHGMIIGDIECIVFGHEIFNDPVATHPFYGSRQYGGILDNLHMLRGMEDGYIVLQGGKCVERDTETNLVVGLYQNN